MLRHKDYASVLPHEKKKAKATVKEVMAKTEELKEVLRARFSAEHELWLRAEKRRQEEDEVRAIEERKRAEEEARCKAAEAASIERDRQVLQIFSLETIVRIYLSRWPFGIKLSWMQRLEACHLLLSLLFHQLLLLLQFIIPPQLSTAWPWTPKDLHTIQAIMSSPLPLPLLLQPLLLLIHRPHMIVA